MMMIGIFLLKRLITEKPFNKVVPIFFKAGSFELRELKEEAFKNG